VLEDRSLLSTVTVNVLTDNNPTGGGQGGNGMGDLRWCILESLFRADTINFSVTGTINLAAPLATLTRSVSIEGPGADLLTVRRDTGGDYRIFTVGSGVTAGISGLTLTNGDVSGSGILNSGTLTLTNSTISGNTIFGSDASNGGGGIYNSGTLTVNNSTISGNYVDGLGARGGGILTTGTLTVNNSTISGNRATGGGGGGGGLWSGGTLTVNNSTILGNTGQGFGGAIWTLGTLTVTNSTIASNLASSQGGGIWDDSTTLTVTNSTIAGNSAGYQGGGIMYAVGQIAVRNTIVAGNAAPAGPDVYGYLGSQGHNLIGNPQDFSGWVDTDLLHVDPLLGPLQNNGGPTSTMALLAGSPALNAGDPAQLGVADQRGVVRSGGVNIGAYQASASAFALTDLATVTAGMPFNMTVKAVDTFGQTALDYRGTATFSTTDTNPAVVRPANYTFLASDSGTHTFTGGVTLATAGSQTLTATDTAASLLTGSATVLVSPAAADHLLFLQQPTDTAAGQIMGAVIVEVVDQFGNVETSDNSDTITLSIGTNPSGGTLSGTLTLTVVNGVATFSDLSIDLAGSGYTLHATVGGGLPDIDSNPFNIF
jgi:hypothetical protein